MIALGSNSQTRAKILTNVGVEFVRRNCYFDEDKLKITTPIDYVYQIAKGKFEAYLRTYDLDLPFVVADTIVCVGGSVLLKAQNEADALRMLKLQSSNSVEIITCMIYKSKEMELTDLSCAKYQFMEFDDRDLESYIRSGEWRDKAGACMVEGFCERYIKSSEGFESTAMGLSVERLLPFLESNKC